MAIENQRRPICSIPRPAIGDSTFECFSLKLEGFDIAMELTIDSNLG